jgi:hypothetical protein
MKMKMESMNLRKRIVRWNKLSRSTEGTFGDGVSGEIFSLPINTNQKLLAHKKSCPNELVCDQSSHTSENIHAYQFFFQNRNVFWSPVMTRQQWENDFDVIDKHQCCDSRETSAISLPWSRKRTIRVASWCHYSQVQGKRLDVPAAPIIEMNSWQLLRQVTRVATNRLTLDWTL